MTSRPSPWRRHAAWLAAGLAAAFLSAATLLSAAMPAMARRGRAAEPKLSIARIGGTRIGAEERPASSRAGRSIYYVGPKEAVAVTVGTSLPPRARLYPLVRREGTEIWTVQSAAVGPGGRNAAGEWQAEVRFGEPAEAGVRFELRVMVAAQPLPPVPLPEATRAANAIAESAIVPVERRRAKPAVAISAIGGNDVYGNDELVVHEKEMVDLVAVNLTAESQAGVAVRPAGSSAIWVMPGTSGSQGVIQAAFGAGDGSERSFHFTLSAFAARQDEWPAVGRPLSDLEWQRYQAQFLAESRPVYAVRWQDQLRIEKIGRVAVQPGSIVAADRQVDVHGAAKRPLAREERIWIVCIPLQGDPWVAGSTPRLTASGHWSVKAVQLQRDGKPETFDVVAVVSADDAARDQAQAGALRRWLDGVESEDTSTRVKVAPLGARDAARHQAPRKRP